MSKDFSGLLGPAITGKTAIETSVRERIVIREELRTLIQELKPEEFSQLEDNILKEGVRDPLILWPVGETFILVDGHNRYSICQKHKLEFPFKEIAFKNEDEVKVWMIKNQLGRRNLTPEQLSYYRGSHYLREINEAAKGHGVPREDKAKKVALIHEVDAKTIKRDAQFKKGVDIIGQVKPELKEKILKGKSGIARKEIQSIGKNPKLIEVDVDDQILSKTKEKQGKQLTAFQVAQIAFEYILKETRPPKSVYYDLGRDYENIDPFEFFQVWYESTPSNPIERDNT
jgi:ParB-like chromosome segregation protein Spo0J